MDPRTTALMVASPPTHRDERPGDGPGGYLRIRSQPGAWRIVDEIYLELADGAEEGSTPVTALRADPDAIVVSSFSKYFGMTGWRLGWMVLPQQLIAPWSDWP